MVRAYSQVLCHLKIYPDISPYCNNPLPEHMQEKTMTLIPQKCTQWQLRPVPLNQYSKYMLKGGRRKLILVVCGHVGKEHPVHRFCLLLELRKASLYVGRIA